MKPENPLAMSSAFNKAWSASCVRAEAGPQSYARGVSYRDDRRVELADVAANRIRALVRGTIPYRVTIEMSGRQASWSCTCPVGEDGEMCKHVVAVALTAAGADAHEAMMPDRAAPLDDVADVDSDVARVVAGLDRDELVAIVVAQAETDWGLRDRLLTRAAAATNSPIDERTWRRRIEDAFAPYGEYVDYREAEGWADEVGEILEAVGELTETHPAQAAALLEYAYDQANASVQWIDDSDGHLMGISEEIGEMHFAACEAAAIDPVLLARRLVDLELTSELGVFHRAADTYADLLGAAGIAEYRRLIEPTFESLDSRGETASGRGYAIREAMIGVALATGDPDELIRVRSRSLHSADDYGAIVTVLTDAGRPAEAIEWAQRGLAAMADRAWQTSPLREALAALLRESGNIAGAVRLFDVEYRRSPSLDAFRRLLDEADLLGERATVRSAALDHLRAALRSKASTDRDRRSTVLIEILMFEGEIDEAWAVATKHGCSEWQWLNLANARQADHPLDAIPIYQRAALASIEAKNNQGYANAVAHLGRIRQLAQRVDEPALFTELVAQIRTKHKPKRNLMALLDRKRW